MPADQALDNISDGLLSLHLDELPHCLPFNPSGERDWLRATFTEIPRYLFRVFTRKSRGETNHIWTKSMDATDGKPKARVDMFARDDEKKVAGILSRHLRWQEGDEDNLVSWTSSLLFALVYIFHLRANVSDRSSFEAIFLCVIDTTLFPPGVFLRDLDLIRAFRAFNHDLSTFEDLRTKSRGGLFYFGEYLSQGALRIKDKCQIVSARAMIDQGLYDLQPKFGEFAGWPAKARPPWANPVLELRREFYQEPGDAWEVTLTEERVAINIAGLFGGHWALPVAANLFALRPRRGCDQRIIATFRAPRFTDEARKDCWAERTKTVAPSTMPEVRQYAELMRQVHQDFWLTQIKHCADKAEDRLRAAITHARDMNHEPPGANAFAGKNPQYAGLQRQLDTIVALTQVIHKELASSLRAATDAPDSATG